MPTFQTLEDFLEKEQRDDETGRAVLQLCRQLRSALIKISTVVACGPLAGDLAAAQGSNPDGDVQKKLDIVAHDYVIETLRESPAAWVLSEEHDTPIELDRTRPLAIAIDPLDGSSNIETNAPIGTIFSILPNPGPDATHIPSSC
jgi:fructose-1,6-bisphosphatase I